MKYTFILFVIILSNSLYAYELRLHFDKSYIEDNILYADVYTKYDSNLYLNIKKYLDNGVIIALNFRVDLINKRFLIDKNVKEIFFYRKLYYDFFTKEYVMFSSENMKEIRDNDFYSLMKNIYKIKIEILNIDKLNKDSKYLFRTRLSIQLENAYIYLSVFFNIITPMKYRIKWLKSKEFKINEL